MVSNWRAPGSLRRAAGRARRRRHRRHRHARAHAAAPRLRARSAAVITRTVDDRGAALVERARKHPSLEGRDLVREVTCAAALRLGRAGVWRARGDGRAAAPPPRATTWSPTTSASSATSCAACVDVGLPRDAWCRPTTPAREVLALKPDGVFLSNGPGDPAAVDYAVEAARELLAAKLPVFGICLGHQILGLALGGKTYKLKFGHRGANQPVMDLGTAQGGDHLAEPRLRRRRRRRCAGKAVLTHVNLNDSTVEGMRHARAAGVQRAVPPRGLARAARRELLFDRFCTLMEERDAGGSGAPRDDLPPARSPGRALQRAASTSWRRCARARSTSSAPARSSTTTPSCSRGGWRRSSSGTCWSGRSRGTALTPVACALEDGAARPADERRTLARAGDEPPQPVRAVRASGDDAGRRGPDRRRALRGARAAQTARASTAGDLFEARLIWDGETVVFGKTFLFHPPDAREVVLEWVDARVASAAWRARRSCSTCRASTSAGTASATSAPRNLPRRDRVAPDEDVDGV